MSLFDFPDRWQEVRIVLVAARERLNPPVGGFKRAGVVDINDKLAAAEARIRGSEVFEEGEFVHGVCGVFEVISENRLMSRTEESAALGSGI